MAQMLSATIFMILTVKRFMLVKQLNNSGEDIFAEFTNNQFDDQIIVVSSTSHDAAGIDFIVRQQLLMFNQDVPRV